MSVYYKRKKIKIVYILIHIYAMCLCVLFHTEFLFSLFLLYVNKIVLQIQRFVLLYVYVSIDMTVFREVGVIK